MGRESDDCDRFPHSDTLGETSSYTAHLVASHNYHFHYSTIYNWKWMDSVAVGPILGRCGICVRTSGNSFENPPSRCVRAVTSMV